MKLFLVLILIACLAREGSCYIEDHNNSGSLLGLGLNLGVLPYDDNDSYYDQGGYDPQNGQGYGYGGDYGQGYGYGGDYGQGYGEDYGQRYGGNNGHDYGSNNNQGYGQNYGYGGNGGYPRGNTDGNVVLTNKGGGTNNIRNDPYISY